MSDEPEKEAKNPLAAGRPMQIDYFTILSVVMASLLVLSQFFFLFWLDLL